MPKRDASVPIDDGPVYVDETHQRISEFAEDLLDEDEREQFVNHLMERHGYRQTHSWAPGDPDGGQDPDDDDQDPGGQPPRRPSSPGRTGRPRRPQYFKR